MKDLKSKVYHFFKDIERYEHMQLISLTIANKDSTLFHFKKEPYIDSQKQLMFSVTKSITSLAIGMLYDQGLIQLDDFIIDYFVDELPTTYDPLMNEITIRHLLTMTSGIRAEDRTDMLRVGDFRTYYLSQKVVTKPGTYYYYHSATSHMLSGIVTKVTGKTLEDYIKDNLFDPLDITNYEWIKAPEGITLGGYGLSLDNESMIKIGQLLLNKGIYKTRRYISRAYLDMATSPQSIKLEHVENPDTRFIGYQYGFQFHVSPNLSFRADGAFGQNIIIHNNLVIVCTAQYVNFDHLYDKIYYHFSNDSVEYIEDVEIDTYLNTLTYKKTPKENQVNIDKTFELTSNTLNIKSVKFSDDYLLFTYENDEVDIIKYNFLQNEYGISTYAKDLYMVKQKHWVVPNYQKDKLILTILYIETPYVAEYAFNFGDRNLEFTFTPSPNFLLNGFTMVSK